MPLTLIIKAQTAINSVASIDLPGTPVISSKPAKDLTLTGLYNALQALREGSSLCTKEKQIHSAGLVDVLKTLHDKLDAAVLAACGWSDLATPNDPVDTKDELLQRLVALSSAEPQKKPMDRYAGCARRSKIR